MDIDSDSFGVELPQKMLENLSIDAELYAIDYPYSIAANNSSIGFVQVKFMFL